MGQQVESVPIRISYGHDGTHVVMQFSQPVQNNRMTVEQTRAMITALEGILQHLAAHQGGGH